MYKSFDPLLFRQQFPALQQSSIYLDSAATALKPVVVINATHDYYSTNGANVHRSSHKIARQATECFEQARQQIANLLNAANTNTIIWTKGATDSINLVCWAYAFHHLKSGDEIIICESEHHANLVPWLMLAQHRGIKIVKLPLTSNFVPDLSQLPKFLNEKSRLFAISQMSNVTGGCPDLHYAIQLAHANNTLVMVDGAQGIVHHIPDVTALDIDFYAFSTHKLYGPSGLGVLYVKQELLDQMHPVQGGGKMITQVSFDHFTLQKAPHSFEAGTPNIAGVLAVNALLSWLELIDLNAAENYSCQLAQKAVEKLSLLPGFINYRAGNSSLLAFNFADVHHNDLSMLLEEQGIALRAGQHCAQPLMNAMGVSGTLRASFAPYNQPSDVENLVQAVERALDILY